MARTPEEMTKESVYAAIDRIFGDRSPESWEFQAAIRLANEILDMQPAPPAPIAAQTEKWHDAVTLIEKASKFVDINWKRIWRQINSGGLVQHQSELAKVLAEFSLHVEASPDSALTERHLPALETPAPQKCGSGFKLKAGYVCTENKGHYPATQHECECPNPAFTQRWTDEHAESGPAEQVDEARCPKREAERALYEELGFSFLAQNSALTVTIFKPQFRVASLHQLDKKWDVVYLMDKAWNLLVEMKQRELAASLKQETQKPSSVYEELAGIFGKDQLDGAIEAAKHPPVKDVASSSPLETPAQNWHQPGCPRYSGVGECDCDTNPAPLEPETPTAAPGICGFAVNEQRNPTILCARLKGHSGRCSVHPDATPASADTGAANGHIFCGMCGDTGLQNGQKCPQPGCRKANKLPPFGSGTLGDKPAVKIVERPSNFFGRDITQHYAEPLADTGDTPQPLTRFEDFDSAAHPCNKWWHEHGQFMMSGGGRKQFIWACRGWIAREQFAAGAEVTGESSNETHAATGKTPDALTCKQWETVPSEEADNWSIRAVGENYGKSVAKMLWEEDAKYIVRLHNAATLSAREAQEKLA